MGSYRFFLAILVAISHAGIGFFGYNPGVVAVISFYILSGYVMSLLIVKYYAHPSAIPTFYLDRAARLFPQFVFYMLLATIFIYFLKFDSQLTNKPTINEWLLNLLILPLGFYMYWADGPLVIPQAWSPGLEMTFYLAIPWILIFFSNRKIYTLACLSFLIFLTAYCGKINSDIFGYRLLFGTLFMFLIGWSFSKNDSNSIKFRFIALLLAGALLLIAFFNNFIYQLPYNKEVLAGLIIGIPAINFIRHLNPSKIDEFLGNLSYGVFLNHFIIIWLMQKFLTVKSFDIGNITILLASSCALALGSFLYIERPALKWRYTIRNGITQKRTNKRASQV
ncbi:Acyltransferase family protein [Hydrogenophaga sp. T4]|nr:Acyltransferase family protein [Hydrogenophaga sp. T4]